jgi:hypothetical protein
LIGVRTTSEASKSNSASGSESESVESEGMSVGTRSALNGLIDAYSGSRMRVCSEESRQ